MLSFDHEESSCCWDALVSLGDLVNTLHQWNTAHKGPGYPEIEAVEIKVWFLKGIKKRW